MCNLGEDCATYLHDSHPSDGVEGDEIAGPPRGNLSMPCRGNSIAIGDQLQAGAGALNLMHCYGESGQVAGLCWAPPKANGKF